MARITIRIPTPLRSLVDDQEEIEVEARTVEEALQRLAERNDRLRAQLYGADGQLRSFVNIFVEDRDIRELDGAKSELRDATRISIVPSIAGGRVRTTARTTELGGTALGPTSIELAAAEAELTADEMQRYSRHLAMPEVGTDGQKRLKSASVLLVGVGGLGSPAGLYLAAAGIGRMGLVDYDTVDFTNLQRQVLHTTDSVGRSKLDSARERIRGLNPNVRLETFATRLTSENALEILESYDLVVDGSDNFPTRYLVNDACVLLGIPLVYGAIFRFEGQASVFGVAGGPCYRCLFREPPPAALAPNCAEAGVLGVLPGIVGTIQATEAIKLILGRGDTLAGRLLLIDALKMEFRNLSIRRDAECPVCGDEPTVTRLIDYEQFCASSTDEGGDDQTAIPHIDVRELKDSLDTGRAYQILDVREPYEWEICNLGSWGARLVPLGELSQRLAELDPEAPWVVHCRSGARSAKAVELLRDAGFSDVVNLEGGILAWASEIETSLPTY